AEVLAVAHLRQEGVLQRPENWVEGREQDHPQQMLDQRPAAAYLLALGPPDAAPHGLDHVIKDRKEDVLLVREVMGEMATSHLRPLLDRGQGQLGDPLLGDDGGCCLDDLLPALAADVGPITSHAWTTSGEK